MPALVHAMGPLNEKMGQLAMGQLAENEYRT
jgi:hypothetical protein